MRKILYSPGYGAGWSTWCSGSKQEKLFMMTYKPFIKAIENGEKIPKDKNHPLVAQFCTEYEMKFFKPAPYLGGIGSLKVANIPNGTRFRIDEYDGSESVITENDDDDSYF